MKQNKNNLSQFSEEKRFLDSLLDQNTLQTTNLKKILSFTNSLTTNELFFSKLSQVLLQVVTLSHITKAQKINAYTQLFTISLNNQNLPDAFSYYGILKHKMHANNAVIFKLDKLFCQKYYDLLQYKQALHCLQNMLSSKRFFSLTLLQKQDLILRYASILLHYKKPKLDLVFENETLQNLVNTINNNYFVLANSKSKKQKQLLPLFECFYNNPNTQTQIKENILLNLPIVLIFIKQNKIMFPYKVLTQFLQQNPTPVIRKEILLILLPILKNKNIQEFLNTTPLVPITINQLDNSIQQILENYTKLSYENYKLQNSLKEKELKLKTDNLTGCLSANALEDIKIDFKNTSGAVVFFDLNKLKEYNDSMGHQAGNDYLLKFSSKLLTYRNDKTELYRIGGDEFLMIAQGKTQPQITKILNSIVKSCNHPIKLINNKKISISFSAGISFYPQDATSLSKLTLLADKAMYQAKAEKPTANHYKLHKK